MNKRLEKLYDDLNAEFWNGTLPKIECKTMNNMPDADGEFFFPKNASEDTPDHKKYKIVICRKLLSRKKDLRDTMLHEMCHLSMFLLNKEKYWKKKLSWHGTYWKMEMIRVGFKPPITPST